MYTGKCLSPERSWIIGKSLDYNDYCCLWHISRPCLMLEFRFRSISWKLINARFSHRFSVFNLGCGPWSILMPDMKRRALISPTLITENPWFNVIIIHFKFIYSPFTILFWTIFQYFFNLLSSNIGSNTCKSGIEMNTCSCLSFILPSMLFEINM